MTDQKVEMVMTKDTQKQKKIYLPSLLLVETSSTKEVQKLIRAVFNGYLF